MSTRGDSPAGPAWTQPEIAWFLAVAWGFAAAWIGAVMALPGAGVFLAVVAAAVFQAVLLRGGHAGTAGMAAVAMALGVTLGAVALVGESGLEVGAASFPLARTYVALQIAPLLAGDAGSLWLSTAASAGVIALLLLFARPTQGLAPLAAGMIAGGAFGAAGAHAGRPEEGVLAVLDGLQSIPPWALFQLCGMLLLQVLLTSRGALLPLAELGTGRRRLLKVGLALLLLGLILQPIVGGVWARWVPAG